MKFKLCRSGVKTKIINERKNKKKRAEGVIADGKGRLIQGFAQC